MPEKPNQLIDPELQPHDDGSTTKGVGVSPQLLSVPHQSQQPPLFLPPQQQWQQPMPPQQGWQSRPPMYPPPQYQYPPQMPLYYPPMPPQQPPKKRVSGVKIILIFLGILVVLGLISSLGHSQSSTNTATQPQPQASPAHTPQPQASPAHTQPIATAKPTQTRATIGSQVVLGGTEDSFTANFGNPISRTTTNGAPVLMYDTGDSNVGMFGVVLVPGTHTVFGMVIAAPEGQPWDATTALTTCVKYLPEDGKLDQPQNVNDGTGLYQSGYSTELANSLSPGVFLGPNNSDLVKPGTFSTKYSYADNTGTLVNLCSIRLGKQQ